MTNKIWLHLSIGTYLLAIFCGVLAFFGLGLAIEASAKVAFFLFSVLFVVFLCIGLSGRPS